MEKELIISHLHLLINYILTEKHHTKLLELNIFMIDLKFGQTLSLPTFTLTLEGLYLNPSIVGLFNSSGLLCLTEL